MKINNLKYLILFAITFLYIKSVGQDFIAAKSFVKNEKVYLRWVPSNFNTLQNCLENGFVIKRIVWKSTNLPDSNKFKTTNFIKYIKPFSPNDVAWKNKIEQNTEAGFLYNVLYKSNTKNTSSDDYFYGLAMLKCDQDTSLAKASGLFYIDDEIVKEKYAYLIQPKNFSGKKIKPVIFLVNTEMDDYLPTIDSLKTKTSKKEVSLIWPEEKYKSFYTGYYVERSEDGVNYKQLNKKPHIQLKTKDDKNKTDIIYLDSTVKYNNLYYYRVKGLNFFGASGFYSNISKIKLIKPIEIAVSLDSSKVYKDSLQKIYWHTVGKINSDELKGYNIFRSVNEQGHYQKINKSIIKDNTFYIDEKPEARNYYKIVAYNVFGDSTTSFNIMAMQPDIKPPLPPNYFTGKIDSNGMVNLSWHSNKEPDLKGYRVFRCNTIKEEPVEITTKFLYDTVYTDKININTLTENIIYYLTAVDNVFNNSKYTLPLILKRPDKIKPVPVIFKSLTHNDTLLEIHWINSSSIDANKYELYRIEPSGQTIKIKEWLSKDSLSSFKDNSINYDNYYSYKIRVTDGADNFSETISQKHYYSSRLRKPIASFNYTLDKETKSIILEWQAPSNDVYTYVLYKAKKGSEYISYKTFKTNVLKFEDKELNIGNIYLYKIKANLNSGAETILSKELNIEF